MGESQAVASAQRGGDGWTLSGRDATNLSVVDSLAAGDSLLVGVLLLDGVCVGDVDSLAAGDSLVVGVLL